MRFSTFFLGLSWISTLFLVYIFRSYFAQFINIVKDSCALGDRDDPVPTRCFLVRLQFYMEKFSPHLVDLSCSILRDVLRFLSSRGSWLSTSATVRASRTAFFRQRYPQCNCVFLHHEMNDTTRHQTERQLELFARCDHCFGKPQTLFLSSSLTFLCVAQFPWDCHFLLS